MRQWKNDVLTLHYEHAILNHDERDGEDYLIKEYEVALKHDHTGAVVKLTDDGFIDVFAGPETGIRIDPHTKSVNLFGDSVNILANHFNVRTQPQGFNWNKGIFNPALYDFPPATAEAPSETTAAAVMLKAPERARYSPGMLEIMKSLGLPVELPEEEEA